MGRQIPKRKLTGEEKCVKSPASSTFDIDRRRKRANGPAQRDSYERTRVNQAEVPSE